MLQANLVPVDLRCLKCGYAIEGLPVEGRCPECSILLANSIRGPFLAFSAPEYVTLLHRGVVLILASIIVRVLLVIMNIVASITTRRGAASADVMDTAFVLAWIVGTGVAIATLLGWWLFSAPDPAFAQDERGASARRIIRAVVVVQAAIAVLDMILGFTDAIGTSIALGVSWAVLSLGITAVQFFASMIYLRWLAPRLPDRAVSERADRYMWLLPVLSTVGVLLAGLGPLIALVMYWKLFDAVRKRLKAIRIEQGSMRA